MKNNCHPVSMGVWKGLFILFHWELFILHLTLLREHSTTYKYALPWPSFHLIRGKKISYISQIASFDRVISFSSSISVNIHSFTMY